jgi:hypothetical protein
MTMGDSATAVWQKPNKRAPTRTSKLNLVIADLLVQVEKAQINSTRIQSNTGISHPYNTDLHGKRLIVCFALFLENLPGKRNTYGIYNKKMAPFVNKKNDLKIFLDKRKGDRT